jgi:GR25 family glycosyltransferase involved in LPS biosynthesis
MSPFFFISVVRMGFNRLATIVVLSLLAFLVLMFQRARSMPRADHHKSVVQANMADNLEFDVYLINLDSAKDRLTHFKKMYAATDMHDKGFIRRRATNGRVLDISAHVTPKALHEILLGEKHGYRTKHYELTRGGVGCYLSHMDVWKYIRGTDKAAALVLEDDVVLRDDFHACLKAVPLPDDWDIMLLGYVCNICRRDQRFPRLQHVKKFFGMHAYLISQKGINTILAHNASYPIGKQVDSMLSDMISEGRLRVYATSEKLAVQNNRDFKTQIQIPLQQVDGVDPWTAE